MVNKIDLSNNSSHCVLCLDATRFGKLFTDWLMECMNPDMTPCWLSLDVGALT